MEIWIVLDEGHIVLDDLTVCAASNVLAPLSIQTTQSDISSSSLMFVNLRYGKVLQLKLPITLKGCKAS